MGGRVILAGGSGFIGTALGSYLSERGFNIEILSRSGGTIKWDGVNSGEWCRALEGADAVINLAGRNINCRLTDSNRSDILESRVNSAKALTDAVNRCSDPPGVFIQSSAVGFYGDTRDECTEASPMGSGFLADVCSSLEDVAGSAELSGTRTCIIRLGVVLGRGGGAYPVLERLTKYFMGGALGSGRQYVSWIHIIDLCRIVELIITGSNMNGAYNVSSPEPVTNAEFMRSFRQVLRRPWSPPVPAAAVRIGTYLIGSNSTMLLKGQRVLPAKLLECGYEFKYAQINKAIMEVAGI